MKTSKLNTILLFVLFVQNTTNAQDIKGKRLYSGEMQNISYLIYPSETKIKAGVTSQKELRELITNNEDFMAQYNSDKVTFSESSRTQLIQF